MPSACGFRWALDTSAPTLLPFGQVFLIRLEDAFDSGLAHRMREAQD